MKPGTVFQYVGQGDTNYLVWNNRAEYDEFKRLVPKHIDFGGSEGTGTQPNTEVRIVWQPPAGPEHGILAPDVIAMAPAVDSKIAFAAKKVPLYMVPLKALYGVARVFAYGRKKHGAGNFLKACLSDGAGERYSGAELRHLSETQNLDGTWDLKSLAALDDESGLPHIDHILATVIMLRAIMVKDGLLQLDPGEGNEPPKAAP